MRNCLILIVALSLLACSSEEEVNPADLSPPSETLTESTDHASTDNVENKDIINQLSMKNLVGSWACDEPIINTGLDPDIDGLFDRDTIVMTKTDLSFDSSFRGLIFWLERDSSLKVATDYTRASESKPYFERYASAYFEKSVWHHSRANNTLILEFHFNDGIDEISQVHYSIRGYDEDNFTLIRTQNKFWVVGEEI